MLNWWLLKINLFCATIFVKSTEGGRWVVVNGSPTCHPVGKDAAVTRACVCYDKLPRGSLDFPLVPADENIL